MGAWNQDHQPARLEERLEDGRVRCHLSPRNCTLKEGQLGFCRVRGNVGGRLVTFNYGKGVQATEETVETEAVNHYAPGSRILSMGNVGCMLNCDYCHNWKTSQARLVEERDVHRYTPEGVVETARRHAINILSWTYNDPVVWQEFVVDTATLGQAAGLRNLYKSAFFITPEAVEQLLPVMDVFSISLKSMDPEYYPRYTKGRLEPVLEAIKLVHRAGKHLELSTLMITGVSDGESTARAVAEWVVKELSPHVPVHFVRFHPDYKMASGVRTPLENLARARAVGLETGLTHVYLGNVLDPDATSTRCAQCQAVLVTRFGLNATVTGLDEAGHCSRCGWDAHVKLLQGPRRPTQQHAPTGWTHRQVAWHGDVRSTHVQFHNRTAGPALVLVRRTGGGAQPWTQVHLNADERFRMLVAQGTREDTGMETAFPPGVETRVHEVFDRAHFPTVALEGTQGGAGDTSPLPLYRPHAP